MGDGTVVRHGEAAVEGERPYTLYCGHPYIEDTSSDPDEEYYEIVFNPTTHSYIPAHDDTSELEWVERHARETVSLKGRQERPRPIELRRIVKSW